MKVLFSLIFMLVPTFVFSSPNVLMVLPAAPQNPFWGLVASTTQKVAKDLNINLKIRYGNDRSAYRKQISRVSQEKNIDYLITYYERGTGKEMLENLEKTKIKTFFINSDITPDSDKKKMGLPREKFKNWIGHMYPDDEKAGYDLAKSLIKQASRSKAGRIEVVGISGGRASTPGLLRAKGLKRACQEDPRCDLKVLVYIPEWNPDNAADRAAAFMERFPNTSVFWAASDLMASKIITKLGQNNKKLHEDYYAGGIDLTPETLKNLQANKVNASVGGHFMEGVWALILINDYHKGIDFKDDIGLVMKSEMLVVDSDNITKLQDKLTQQALQKFDYRVLSKAVKPSKKYHFDLEYLLTN